MRKYYTENNNQTIRYGEESEVTRDHPDAVEIPNPPGSSPYYWWDGTKWFFDQNMARKGESSIVSEELQRLTKFEMLPAAKKTTIATDLEKRKVDLNNYLNNLTENSVMPEFPSSLTEENYFNV